MKIIMSTIRLNSSPCHDIIVRQSPLKIALDSGFRQNLLYIRHCIIQRKIFNCHDSDKIPIDIKSYSN